MNDITALPPVTPEMLASLKLSASNLAEGEMMSFEPAVFRALVEALEKAQRANAAQDDHINQQQDRIDTLEKRNADLGKYAGKLESSHKKLREGMAAIYNAICADGASTSVSAILTFVKRAHEESVTAGIQVIEGEGQCGGEL